MGSPRPATAPSGRTMSALIAPMLELFSDESVKEKMVEAARQFFPMVEAARTTIMPVPGVTISLLPVFVVAGLIALCAIPLLALFSQPDEAVASCRDGSCLVYGAPSYGAPSYGAPSYGAPSYGSPEPTYGPPVDSYGPPVDTYGPPVDTYGPPVDTYGPPVDTYGPPVDSYGPPVSTYGAPSHHGRVRRHEFELTKRIQNLAGPALSQLGEAAAKLIQ